MRLIAPPYSLQSTRRQKLRITGPSLRRANSVYSIPKIATRLAHIMMRKYSVSSATKMPPEPYAHIGR